MAETTTTEAKQSEAKKKTSKSRGKYIFAIGRRKSSTVRIKFYEKGTGKVTVNGSPLDKYFKTLEQQQNAVAPLSLLSLNKKVDMEIKASGGGLKGQADAVKLAIARALVKADEENKPTLKEHGFMTVDARVKERKKPGLKRARRAPQWRKR